MSNSRRQSVVRVSEALFLDQFEKVANLPIAWRLTAESLLRAARVLVPMMEEDSRAAFDPATEHPEHPVGPVYMMLAGFAVENLTKALIIEKDASPVTKGGALVLLKTHDLIDLLDQAGLTLSEEAWYLAERLEAFLWAGRYATATNVEAQLPRTHPQGGWGSLTHIVSSDPEDIETLVGKLTPD